MPSTGPRPTQKPTKESIRTAIIVGLVISLLGVILLAYVIYQRRLRRHVKAGAVIGRWTGGRMTRRTRRHEERAMEIGVIREPLPVYARDVKGGEKRLDMGLAT
jgi:H+/gluconate symporter-like permease